MKEEYTVVRQDWEESERGWGTRPDGYTLHLTMEDHAKYVAGYYAQHNSLDHAPDEYTRTAGGPKPVTVDAATFKELEAHKKKRLGRGGYLYARCGIWKR